MSRAIAIHLVIVNVPLELARLAPVRLKQTLEPRYRVPSLPLPVAILKLASGQVVEKACTYDQCIYIGT